MEKICICIRKRILNKKESRLARIYYLKAKILIQANFAKNTPKSVPKQI